MTPRFSGAFFFEKSEKMDSLNSGLCDKTGAFWGMSDIIPQISVGVLIRKGKKVQKLLQTGFDLFS
jgi:hypothetical protein